MGTGLIYAAIVAAWAAYLVPGWIRRHEEVADAAPGVDRPPAPPARVLERRQSSRGGPAHLLPDQAGDTRRPPVPGPRRSAPARSSAVVRRRRRILVGLIGLTTIVAVLGAFRLAPWWALAVPVSIVAAYLLICAVFAAGPRGQGVRTATSSTSTDGRAVAKAPGSLRSGRTPGGRGSVRTTAARLAETADCPVSEARTVSARVEPSFAVGSEADGGADETPVGVPAARASTDGGLWDPVQVPLPTYVTKAKATRTVRTVELGSWSSERLPEADLLSRPDEPMMLLDETEQPSTARDEPPSDAGGSERRRAVGD